MKNGSRFAVLCLALASACLALHARSPALQVATVERLGSFTTNASAYGRDAGNSARIGESIIWIFGDTLTPSGLRSATAAWSLSNNPLKLREAVDGRNAPYQFYPFTSDEVAFNRDHANPPACCADQSGCKQEFAYCNCPTGTDCAQRIALWPGDAFATRGTSGVSYFQKLIVGVAPYDFRHVGTGVARFDERAAVAVRDLDEQGNALLLFTDPEPNFFRAVVGKEERAEPVLYVYAALEHGDCTSDVLISKVARGRVTDRSAYAFWDGSEWVVADVKRAHPILTGIAGQLGSVAWSDHLGAYVSGFSDTCTGGNKIHMRGAPRPEGPWSEPLAVDLAPMGVSTDSYAGLLHPVFGMGRRIVFSYYEPAGDFQGQVHLAKLTLY